MKGTKRRAVDVDKLVGEMNWIEEQYLQGKNLGLNNTKEDFESMWQALKEALKAEQFRSV
jgi:hypothetical protein